MKPPFIFGTHKLELIRRLMTWLSTIIFIRPNKKGLTYQSTRLTIPGRILFDKFRAYPLVYLPTSYARTPLVLPEPLPHGTALEHLVEHALNYYSLLFQYDSADQRLQITQNSVLRNLPGWVYYHPWTKKTPDQRMQQINKTIYEENMNHGLAMDALSGGASLTNIEKIKVEKNRFTQLFSSIINNGYEIGSNTAINAYVLVDNTEWCWLIRSGKHRAIALALLGYTEIPVRINQIIYKHSSSTWLPVITGILTKEEAENHFSWILQQSSTNHL